MSNSNPGGPGGRRKKIHVNKARGKTSHRKARKSMKLPPTWLILLIMLIGAYLAYGLLIK